MLLKDYGSLHGWTLGLNKGSLEELYVHMHGNNNWSILIKQLFVTSAVEVIC